MVALLLRQADKPAQNTGWEALREDVRKLIEGKPSASALFIP